MPRLRVSVSTLTVTVRRVYSKKETIAMWYKISELVGGVVFRVLSLDQSDQVVLALMHALTTAYKREREA